MKTRLLIIIAIVGVSAIIIIPNFSLEEMDSMILLCNHWVFSDTRICKPLWIESEPEPKPMPESETLQKQQQAKLHVQEVIMIDYRGHEHQINAINEYRNEFETDYFLEQFILSNKQNYEKDDLINFIFVEWGYQQQECTFPKVEVYLRSYENYSSIEKISEWQKSEEECYSMDSDSNGYLIMNAWPMPGIFEPRETCTIPGEYRVVASNLKDESKKEFGYFTCQQEKLDGISQPWMDLPR